MAQPELPDGFDWPELTRCWWQTWGEDPRTRPCTDTDWLFLQDGAILHASIWGGGDADKVGDLRNHLKVWEARLAELAKSAPVERKDTPLDELRKRREARQAGAARKARPSRGTGI